MRVVAVGLALLAVLPPLLWMGIGYAVQGERLHALTDAVAWTIEEGGASRLQSALSAPTVRGWAPGGDPNTRITLRDELDGAVDVGGASPGWPTISRRLRLERSQGNVAVIDAERSLRPLLAETAIVALASCTAIFALWWFALLRPVTALRRAEGRMRSQATIDTVTGLLNREGLRRRLLRALEGSLRSQTKLGVLMIDIDRFRLINESLGQEVGDQLLRGVGDRIRAVTRDGDSAARVTGDQFAVQVEGISGDQALAAMARNLLRAFEAPYSLAGRDVVITLSIGVAIAADEKCSVDALLHRAGVALRVAQVEGGNRYRVYSPSMDEDMQRRLDIEQRLRGALAAGQFRLLYQPIVGARTRRVEAVEALLRWDDPGRGLVPPAEFIPVLEQTDMIVPVGDWVLRQACLQAAQWARAGRPKLVVSVNLSPRQFGEPEFLDKLSAVLRETGLPPDHLQLEVTEGLLLDPTPEVLQRVDGLADMGVRLAVDDFGMGYSSLLYLKRFRLHCLKIDQLFVRDMVSQQQDLAIVRAIIDLGHGLGLTVTAEGVETEEQAHELRRLGCDMLQGYLFARPQLAEAVSMSSVEATPLALEAAPVEHPAPALPAT
jgi:diguanylate cyclase (GGDEF)-like protein